MPDILKAILGGFVAFFVLLAEYGSGAMFDHHGNGVAVLMGILMSGGPAAIAIGIGIKQQSPIKPTTNSQTTNVVYGCAGAVMWSYMMGALTMALTGWVAVTLLLLLWVGAPAAVIGFLVFVSLQVAGPAAQAAAGVAKARIMLTGGPATPPTITARPASDPWQPNQTGSFD